MMKIFASYSGPKLSKVGWGPFKCKNGTEDVKL